MGRFPISYLISELQRTKAALPRTTVLAIGAILVAIIAPSCGSGGSRESRSRGTPPSASSPSSSPRGLEGGPGVSKAFTGTLPKVDPAVAAAGPIGLSHYWTGAAEWKLTHIIPEKPAEPARWPGHFGTGSHITIGPDGAWFLFSRRVHWNYKPDGILWPDKSFLHCFELIGTDVRRSTDKGRTWGERTQFLFPRKACPGNGMGGDGDAYPISP